MKSATLTARQRRFVDEYLIDGVGAAAAVRAGYAPGSAKVAASRMLTKDNPVSRAIEARQSVDSERLRIDRQRVISGLLEAIEQGRQMRDPRVLIRGWAEIAKLLGLYAVETKRVEVNSTVAGTMERLELLSDAELVNLLAAGQGAN